VSCGSLVGAAEQPNTNRFAAIKTRAIAKLLDLRKDRRMPALIWLCRGSVNRMRIDASHSTLLKVGSSESEKEEDEP